MGYAFLRQRPVGNFIADFMCKELKLIIEVDGYSHNFKIEEDIARDKILTDLGYSVLRFTDEEILNDLPNVQRMLESWITERQK